METHGQTNSARLEEETRCTGGRGGPLQKPSFLLIAGNRSAHRTPTLLHTCKALLTHHHLFIALLSSKEDHRKIIYSCTSVKRFGFETDARHTQKYSLFSGCLMWFGEGGGGREAKTSHPYIKKTKKTCSDNSGDWLKTISFSLRGTNISEDKNQMNRIK